MRVEPMRPRPSPIFRTQVQPCVRRGHLFQNFLISTVKLKILILVFQILPSVDNSESQAVKTEEPSLLENCIFNGQPKSMSSEQSDCSGQSSKRQEDTPMEVSSNQTPSDIFKVA